MDLVLEKRKDGHVSTTFQRPHREQREEEKEEAEKRYGKDGD